MLRYYYYFHPAYTYYLDALKAFLNACGGISRELALLSELSATEDCYGIIHPEQIAEDWQRLFYDPKYYNGSLDALKESIKMKKKGYKYRDKNTGELIEVIGTEKAWRMLRAAALAADIKIVGKESEDPEAWKRYGRFYNMVASLETICDLRAMVHKWIAADREKIANGQATITPDPALVADKKWRPLPALSIEEIFTRYDKLLVKRKQTGK